MSRTIEIPRTAPQHTNAGLAIQEVLAPFPNIAAEVKQSLWVRRKTAHWAGVIK